MEQDEKSRVAGECAQPPASKRAKAKAQVWPSVVVVRLVAATPALLLGQMHPGAVDGVIEFDQQLDGLDHLLQVHCACVGIGMDEHGRMAPK